MTDRIDPTAAVPITVASDVAFSVVDLRTWARRTAATARRDVERFRLWLDRQHLDPNLVAHLIALALASIATIAEAWANLHRNR